MQTCSRCHTQSPDTGIQCPECQADLLLLSTTAVSREEMQINPRVKMIILAVGPDSCPDCSMVQGTYEKDKLPILPIEGCSQENGCSCFYEPVLDEIYP